MSIATPEFGTAGPEAGARSEDYLWTLNFGPQHPATHTTLRLVLKLDGERVVDAMPREASDGAQEEVRRTGLDPKWRRTLQAREASRTTK